MKNQGDKIREELSDLICRELSGKLDEAGIKRLRQLEREYELESVDRIRIAARLRNGKEFDYADAYADFRQITGQKSHPWWRLNSNVWLTVAATMILFIGVWLILGRQGQKPVISVVEKADPVITPGESKATITLASGEQVTLGNMRQRLQEKNGTVLNLDSAVVEYKGSGASGQVVYNTISIPIGGEYQLILADGSKVWINADSKLRFPVNFVGKRREVFLEGEAYFEVVKDKSRPFVVHTSRGNIEVLGTGFNVRDYREEKKVVTTLVTGRVAYHQEKDPTKEVILAPGFQVEDDNNGNLKPRQVDVMLYTGWKDGMYMFENATLEEIMRVLSKWYDIAVFYKREDVKNLHFTGDLERYKSINDFLEFMEIGGNVRFTVKGKTITIE